MSIITQTQFYRELAKLVRETYPKADIIPWYRLLLAEPVWPTKATPDGTWYQQVYVYGLRNASISTYQMLHDWYLADANSNFLIALARVSYSLYPVPHMNELRRRKIADADVRIDWRGWHVFFEARMITAFSAQEIRDKDAEALIEHLGGKPDETKIQRAYGIRIGVEALMPSEWCSSTFNVLNKD